METEDSWLENVFCKRPIAERDSYEARTITDAQSVFDLTNRVQELTREKNSLVASAGADGLASLQKINALEVQITTLNAQIASLTIQINSQVPATPQHSPGFNQLPLNTQTLVLTYLNKYPEAFITYDGRYWGAAKNRYKMDVKAWLLEGQNDFAITSHVGEVNARVSDVLHEQPDLTFHQACDIAYMRVTHYFGDSINYTFDSTTWGADVPEYWQFASETMVIKKGDCEDKAILNDVAATIAGIPRELRRITAGMTNDNQGHCTNYYFASDLHWHHRNSTTNYAADKAATSLPLNGDSTESLGIKTPWFSATADKTFNWFGTEAQKRDTLLQMAEDEFGKFLNIRGKI